LRRFSRRRRKLAPGNTHYLSFQQHIYGRKEGRQTGKSRKQSTHTQLMRYEREKGNEKQSKKENNSLSTDLTKKKNKHKNFFCLNLENQQQQQQQSKTSSLFPQKRKRVHSFKNDRYGVLERKKVNTTRATEAFSLSPCAHITHTKTNHSYKRTHTYTYIEVTQESSVI